MISSHNKMAPFTAKSTAVHASLPRARRSRQNASNGNSVWDRIQLPQNGVASTSRNNATLKEPISIQPTTSQQGHRTNSQFGLTSSLPTNKLSANGAVNGHNGSTAFVHNGVHANFNATPVPNEFTMSSGFFTQKVCLKETTRRQAI